jgi:hypothetical protein
MGIGVKGGGRSVGRSEGGKVRRFRREEER